MCLRSLKGLERPYFLNQIPKMSDFAGFSYRKVISHISVNQSEVYDI